VSLSLTPRGRGDLGVEPDGQNMHLQIAAATRRIEMKSDSAFCQITLVLVRIIVVVVVIIIIIIIIIIITTISKHLTIFDDSVELLNT